MPAPRIGITGTWGALCVLALVAIGLPGCAGYQPPVPDTATLPPGSLGTENDTDMAAINLTQWAFADSSRTYGRPVVGARAAASLEYLAGEIATSPRWGTIDPLTKLQLIQSRADLRRVLGVAPDARAQAVVDSLLAAGAALAADDRPGAERALTNPIFTQGGAATLATLGNLPYIQTANVATQSLGNAVGDDSAQSLRL